MTDGERNFIAYRDSAGGVSYDGTPIPEWKDLRPTIKSHWAKGAEAVLANTFGTRSRDEIEERVGGFVYLLANTKKIEDHTVWLHLRVRELLWVLHPSHDMDDLDELLNRLVEDKKREQH